MEAAVYEQLHAACFGKSPSEQENAMRALRDIEEGNAHNMYALISVLAAVVVTRTNTPEEMRLLAVICLKNMSLKSWTKIDESCKNAMWQFVHKALDEAESNRKISTQTAVLTAKICRKEWPSDLVTKQLFPYLFTLLGDGSNWRRQSQSLRTIREILEEVGCMRLPNSRSALAALALDAFPPLLAIWTDLSRRLQESLPSPLLESRSSMGALVKHLTSLACVLKQLLGVGYELICASTDMNAFFGSFVQLLSICSQFCRQVLNQTQADEMDEDEEEDDEEDGDEADNDSSASGSDSISLALSVRRLIAEMSALIPHIQAEFPLLVVPLLLPFLGYAHSQLIDTYASPSSLIFSERLVLSSITILSSILSSGSYSEVDLSSKPKSIAKKLNSNSRTSAEEDSMAAKTGFMARLAFFDESRVNSLLMMLLQRALYPSASELASWRDDGEEYFHQQQGMGSADGLRCAAEGLFLALLDHSGDGVAGYLASTAGSTEAQLPLTQGAASSADVTLWSNVYLCCGLGVYKLQQRIDASDWFSRIIGPLISHLISSPTSSSSSSAASSSSSPPVLLFRCIWLCSCWAHALDAALLPPILDLFIAILADNSSHDSVVILQTIETLSQMLANSALPSALLLERFLRLVEVLCPLASKLHESESKSKVIELLSALMVAVGAHLRPLLGPLAMHLQTLWMSSEPASPLKLALVQALVNVVRVSREASSELHGLLIPVLAYATSGTAESTFLADEAINLWLVVVRNAVSYRQHLDELFRVAVPSLIAAELVQTTDADKARIFMLVVEAHVILGGAGFLSSNAQALKLILDHCVCRVLPRVVSSVTRPIETMLIVCPADAAVFLLQSGALSTMLRPCAAAIPALASRFEEFVEIDMALISYLSVCARLIVVAPAILQQATSSLFPDDNRVLLNGLLRLMIDKFDAVGYSSSGVWRQKLWCIAMMAMYPSGEPLLLEWLPEVLIICDAVATEQGADKDQRAEIAQFQMGESGENVTADPLALAFNAIIAADGVSTVNIKLLVHERLEALRHTIGDALFQQVVRAVDRDARGRLELNSSSAPNSPTARR